MKIIIALLLSLFVLSSCVKEPAYDTKELEARSLKAWIKKNRPELVGNYQQEGGYFVDVLSWGEQTTAAEGNDLGTEAIMDQDTCWVYYNFTGYDLDGNVFSTRDEIVARMQATYTDRTHYVSYGNYCGKEEFYAIVEGSYLASRNKISLSEEYIARADKSSICKGTELTLRKGSKVRLYLPSSIGYSTDGSSAEGGYEGQYSLDGNAPMILDMEVVRVVKNPSDNELDLVDGLVKRCNDSNEKPMWLQIEEKDENSDTDDGDTDDDSSDTEDTEGEEKETKYLDGIYYCTDFTPTNALSHLTYARLDQAGFDNPYKDSDRYADMAAFDKKLWEILDSKFADMISETDAEEAEEVGEESDCLIWYVGRFADGFIFDTNIDEVRELAFGKEESSTAGESISYSVSSSKDDYISAWAHCIPKMRYGRWGALITTSGYAYGSAGVSASTSTSTSSAQAYNALANLYNYYSMMGSSYYNSYSYYNYYNYYGGYNSYYDYGESTTTIETEIAPYAPLVFYVFIEPKE